MGYAPPNYTQTPNIFLDDHLPEMGHAETKVVLAVIRQTFGWQKEEDRISVTQFEKLTGLSRQGVQNGITDAMERGVIKRVPCGQGYKYSLVVEGARHSSDDKACNEVEQPDTDRVCNEVERSVQRGRTEVCNEVDTQKKGKKLPKESARDAAPPETTTPSAPRDAPDTPEQRKVPDVWRDVTGADINAATAQTLRDAFELRGLTYRAVVFEQALRTAYENVGQKAHRIRAGYLMDSYEKRLDSAPTYSSRETHAWRD